MLSTKKKSTAGKVGANSPCQRKPAGVWRMASITVRRYNDDYNNANLRAQLLPLSLQLITVTSRLAPTGNCHS